ncbi:molybdopterin-dependent oxidoreductase [Verrucomicrobiota bacterium]
MKRTLKSTCRMCHGGCGVLLHVDQDKLVQVEGDPESPFSRGSMCVKGMSARELIYHPDRVTFPLKRDGPRGGGRWTRISWEEAISDICRILRDLIDRWGPETVAIGQGTGRHHYLEVLRFANAMGTPNVIEPGAAQCFLPRVTVSQLTYGDFPVGDYNGSTPPRCILFWGANPVVSGPDGKVSFSITRCLPQVKHTIAVDPRRSETAKKCDLHLQIRPGTDAALALAMIHVIIEEHLYDADFVRDRTVGLDDVKSAVQACTPEWASPITWVEAPMIREAARTYAGQKPNILEWGVAVEQTPNSLQTVRSLAVLRGMAGSIDVPGGELLGMHVLKNAPINRGKDSDRLAEKRLGADQYKLLGGSHAFIRMAHAPSVFRAMETGDPYPVNAFLIFGDNALASYPNPKSIGRTLMKMPLVVATDLFRTPTTELADFILPAAAWPELNALVGLPYMAENAVLVQQQAVQVGECLSDEDILFRLAERLGLDYKRADSTDNLDQRLGRTGLTFELLKEQGHYFPKPTYRKYEKKGFRTPSRKIELSSSVLKDLGYAPVPHYREPPESPVSTPDLLSRYPYVLITGARSGPYFHSEGRQIPSRRRVRPDPLAMIHPATAEQNGIGNEDWVEVSSLRGAGRFRARVTDDIHPQVISIDHAWWFPEKGPPEYGIWESNANLLTDGEGPYDPGFGSYQLRALLCRITKHPSP